MKLQVAASVVALFALNIACSATGTDKGGTKGNGSGNQGSGASTSSGGSPSINIGGDLALGGGIGTGATGTGGPQPETCEEAALGHTYVGCDFWPTITANPVYVEFDPAVVIANGSMSQATVTIDGPNAFHQEVTIPAGGLETVKLKWVPELKGPEFSPTNTAGGRLEASARVDGGAYHMVSSVPVTAWQFNPLQYTIPAGSCNRISADGCLSATNDASLLIPSTAMTGSYRVFGYSSKHEGKDWGTVPGGVAITATKANTQLQVQLGPRCGVQVWPTEMLGTCVAAGPGVEAKMSGDILDFTMQAGDVVQLVGAWAADPQIKNADLSGTVVKTDDSTPVQVIAFNAISQLPDASVANADHMEETVLPGEVLGKKYIVAPPATPNGNDVGHVVRIYGNVDGTTLTYPEGKPDPSAPDTIDAGEVVQIPALPTGAPAPSCMTVPGNCMIKKPFVVEADQAFAVASFMVGGVLQMPGTDATNSMGDPGFSMQVTPEQFRKEYTFLAPTDYEKNFADLLVPTGATVMLNGAAVASAPTAIGNSGWGTLRLELTADTGGIHKLTTDHEQGLGLQVMGFGYATSYYYPGGLNLERISEPPVIVVK